MNKSRLIIVGIVVGMLIIVALAVLLNLKKSSSSQPGLPDPYSSPASSQTPAGSPISNQEQSQADDHYSQAEAQVDKNYPWYSKLPLKTDQYFVYFNLTSKTFKASLYPSKSSSTSIDDQTSQLKQIVTTSLQNIGVDTNAYIIEWTVSPE